MSDFEQESPRELGTLLLVKQTALLQKCAADLYRNGLWFDHGKAALEPDTKQFALLCKLNAEIRQNIAVMQRMPAPKRGVQTLLPFKSIDN